MKENILQVTTSSQQSQNSKLSPIAQSLLSQHVHLLELPEIREVDGYLFPLALKATGELAKSRETCLTWLNQCGEQIRVALKDHGALFLRDFAIDGAQDFESAIDAAEFAEMPYVGGAAPREVVTSRRILTANESPPDQPIPFHHEMAQVPSPPGYVFFYCETAPKVGGATPIVHSHKVYQRFREIDKVFCEKLETQGVRYIRIMPSEDDPSSPIGRSWRATFQVQADDLETAQAQAEEKMREAGTTWRWLNHGELYTETATIPAIRIEERTKKPTFFNSVVAAYTGWADTRNDPTKAVCCGDGSAVSGEALLATAQAMQEEQVAISWQEGDMLWIDNRLTMHSRQPYKGARRILAAIAPH